MKGKQNQQFPMRPHITCNHLINAYTDQGWLSLVLTLKSTNSLWTSVGCKSMHTYLKIRNKRIGVHTNWCWSPTDSPAIPSFGVSLGWTSFAKALNDDGGHLTASYPCKKNLWLQTLFHSTWVKPSINKNNCPQKAPVFK